MCAKSLQKVSKRKHGKQFLYTFVKETNSDVLLAEGKETSADITVTIPKGMPFSVATHSGGILKILIANAHTATNGYQEILINTPSTSKRSMGKVSFRKSKNYIELQKSGQKQKSKKLSRPIKTLSTKI